MLLASAVLFLAVENLLLRTSTSISCRLLEQPRAGRDAIFRLSDEAGHITAEHTVVDDWGILNPLIVLHRNRLRLFYADQSFLSVGKRPARSPMVHRSFVGRRLDRPYAPSSNSSPAQTTGSFKWRERPVLKSK